MSRLVIADGGARMLLNQIRIRVESAKGFSFLVQQAGAECPDLVGAAFDQAFLRVFARRKRFHPAVIVKHTNIRGRFLVPVENAVADYDASLRHAIGIAGNRKNGIVCKILL